MALGRGTFENSFSAINSYNVGRKAQELSPGGGGSSRNQPIGSVFSSNIGGNSSSKMGFFGSKKDDVDSNDSDFFYGKNFLSGRNALNDNNSLANQMSNLNIYGFNKTKDPLDRSSSPSWSTGGGWSQMGSGLPQGLGTSSLSNNMLPSASRQQTSMNNNLLQFSRSFSAQSFSNMGGGGSPSGSQSSSDLTNSFQSNLKLMSGQSSPRGGLLSMSQSQQHTLPNVSQQHRGVIGQLPSMSMQQHSSPSHSPGLNLNSKLITSQSTSSSRALPPSSTLPPSSSSAANNIGLTGFGGGLPMRSSNFGQSLLSSVIPSSQNSLLNSDASSLSSTLNNITGLPNPPHQGHIGQPNNSNAFDADFPALANRSGNSSSSRLGQNSFSFVMSSGNKGMEGNQEFQIQNEDFPALPGATQQHLPSDSVSLPTSAPIGSTVQPSLPNHLGQHLENKDGLGDTFGVGSYEQILKDGRLTIEKKQKTGSVSGIQTNASGVITNIPSGMVTDQFGMIGLLTFIRAAETEPNLVTLALGSDLTTLGLNLNSTESLYHTFGSPFSDSTCKPHEIDFYAPQEYLISSYIRDKLAPIKLGRYGEDLLFYLYYTNCGDILQLAAAAELYARDWRYHKDERVWITRFPGMEPQIKTNTYERGTYYYFDPQGWRKVAKEFHVEYERLEEKPTAQALQQQQQQQLA